MCWVCAEEIVLKAWIRGINSILKEKTSSLKNLMQSALQGHNENSRCSWIGSWIKANVFLLYTRKQMQYDYLRILRVDLHDMICIRRYQSCNQMQLFYKNIILILINSLKNTWKKSTQKKKDIKLLHGVYSNKEMVHAEILGLNSQKPLHSQLNEEFYNSNNEIHTPSKIYPEPLNPIIKRINEFNRSHMTIPRLSNSHINNFYIESREESETSSPSKQIKRSSIQFLELPPIKNQQTLSQN